MSNTIVLRKYSIEPGFHFLKKIFFLLFLLLIIVRVYSIPLFAEETPVPKAGFEPMERFNQPWRLFSYLDDASLNNQSIQYLLITKASNAWVCTSTGLYFYDGFTWKHYTESDGLPSENIRVACETKNGNVWIGTDNGVCYFDGTRFQPVDSSHTLASPSVRRIIETDDGAIWFCCDIWPDGTLSGGLTVYKDNQWKSYTTKDGLPSNHIMSYLKDSKGREFVCTKNGVAQRFGERWSTVININTDLENQTPWDIGESSKYGVVVITNTILFCLKEDRWEKFRYSPMDFLSNQRRLCTSRDGKVYTCLEIDEFHNAFFEWNGENFQPVSAPFNSPKSTITSITEAPEGSICCTGDNLLLRWDRNKNKEWSEYTNLPSPRFRDKQNRLWFFGGKGKFRLFNDQWDSIEYPVQNAIKDSQDNVWGWDKNHIYHWTGTSALHFDENQTTLLHIQNAVCTPDGKVYFYGTNAGNMTAIARWADSTWTVAPLPELQNVKLLSLKSMPQEGLWLYTQDTAEKINSLFFYDNAALQKVSLFPEIKNFPNSKITVDPQGTVWLYGQAGLYRLPEGKNREWEKITQIPGKIINLCISHQSDVWVSFFSGLGNNQGIARYRHGEWKTIPSEFCNFADVTDDQTVYFAGNGILYAFSDKNDMVPDTITLPISRPVNAIANDQENNLWLKIGNSVFRHINDEYPCRTFIKGETGYSIGYPIQFSATAKEAYKPAIAGEHFLFSWKLDSNLWTPFSPESLFKASSSQLKTGTHTISVCARDEEGYTDPTPATLSFYIHTQPLQEKSWFLFGVALVFGIVLILSGIAFFTTRKLTKYTASLEEIIQQRTCDLRESEQRLQTILNNSPALISLKDIKGNYVLVNRAYERFIKTPLKEIIGKNDYSFFPEAYAKQFLMNDQFVFKSKIPMEFEETIKENNQMLTFISTKVPLFDDQGEPFAISSISLDITARKEAEKAVQQAEELFRILVENSLAGIYILQKGRILYCNPRFAEIFTYTQSELLSINMVENLVAPDCQEMVNSTIQKSLLKQQNSNHYIFTGCCKDQSQITVEAISAPISYQGQPTIIGTILDITARKKAEEEKKVLEDQLRQSQKMEAIGQLAGGIAHDFNNLLTIIIGYSSILKNHIHSEDTKPFTILSEIINAADQAASMTGQLLAFSRKQILNPEILSLNMVIDGLTSMMKRLLGEQIQVEIIMDTELGYVKTDPIQIKQVILNMAINARDAMPKGGILTITTQNTFLDADFVKTHIDITPGHYALTTISDTGVGISQTILPRIFEPFFTTKKMNKGTGLGLSMAYGIIKQSGGHIWVTSDINKGTSFSIILPLIHAQQVQAEKSPPMKIPTKGKETILLVEDEEAVKDLTKEILKDYGYNVIDTSSPKEALQIYQANQNDIKLVLSDIVMPKLSGPEMMKEIYTVNAKAKVIYMSGYTADMIVKHGILDNGINFIQKPFTPEMLAQKIRKFLDQ